MSPSPSSIMQEFRSLAKAKGWTIQEVWDLLRFGSMAHCSPCFSSVAKWMAGKRRKDAPVNANGEHLLAIQEFLRTHTRRLHDPRPKKKSVKAKSK